jgi:DNA gyrase subunit A
LFFTSAGKVYEKKAYELPEGGRAARGRSIANLLSLANDESLSAFLAVTKDSKGKYVFFATRRGQVKKTELGEFDNIRSNGIIAINLEESDALIGVRLTDGKQQIVLSTREGQAIRFKEDEVRSMGRGTYGVSGMELDSSAEKTGKTVHLTQDELVSIAVARDDETLLTVSENGFGKRTPASEYRLTHRGGKGVITMDVTERTGKVVGVLQVDSDAQVVLVSDHGKIIRLKAKQVRITGRNAQGVHLVKLDQGEKVRAVSPLAEHDDDDDSNGSDNGTGPDDSDSSE